MKRFFVVVLGACLVLASGAMAADTITLTVAHAGAGTGTTSPTVGSHVLTLGDPLVISASPDPGSYFGGWLVNGIFGHDFYRIWWLGIAMSHLGVMIGAVVNGLDSEPEELARAALREDAENSPPPSL